MSDPLGRVEGPGGEWYEHIVDRHEFRGWTVVVSVPPDLDKLRSAERNLGQRLIDHVLKLLLLVQEQIVQVVRSGLGLLSDFRRHL